MFWNQYPYINLNDLNLDFLLNQIKSITDTINNFVALNVVKYANPIQWNITTQYEKNTVVVEPSSSMAYLSVQPVPVGIAITNTDYWTPIFNLDLLSANQNITLHDDGANVLSTFESNAGDWLLWNGILYKVRQHININEAYVDGYNIDRYTVEQFIKDYIVNVMNAIDNVIDSVNAVDSKIGNLNDLTTTDKDNIVDAINELVSSVSGVVSSIGDLDNLNTTDKSDIVSAINEVLGNIGTLADLSTTDKDSIVDAINEVYSMIGSIDIDGRFVTQGSGSIAKILDSETVVNELYTNLYPTQVFSEYGIGYETEIVSHASTDAPETGLAIGIKHHNATSDAVGLWIAADGVQPGCAVFGANIIVTSETVGKMVCLELDYEPSAGIVPVEGNNLILNVFNNACVGSHILIGGVSGGTMDNGITFNNGVKNGCVISAGGLNSKWFINCENGSFSEIAIQLGTGVSKGIGFKTSSPNMGVIFTRGTDFVFKNNAGNLLIGAGNSENTFIVFANGNLGTRTATVTTSASAGSASLPGSPVGFLSFDINGTIRKIPFYG